MKDFIKDKDSGFPDENTSSIAPTILLARHKAFCELVDGPASLNHESDYSEEENYGNTN